MNSYKIKRKFGKFIFNEKTRSNKIRWYEVDEIIDEKEYNRLSKATQNYCDRVSKSKKKRANK